MVETVDAIFVQERLEDGEALVVNVLPEEQFAAKRIRGSVNVPIDSARFEELLREVAPDLDQPIVVHCSAATSQASARAARKLESLGYTEVYLFEGGLEEWATAGHGFESGGPERKGRPERGDRPARASSGLPITGSNRP